MLLLPLRPTCDDIVAINGLSERSFEMRDGVKRA
jgi:hypothetical protein